MDWFYRENIVAVFLGDGRDSRRKAYKLYSDHSINSVFFDDRISFLTRLCPFVQTFCTKELAHDDIILSFVSQKALSANKLPLLYIENDKFRGIVSRNEEYISTRFITDTDEVIKNL